MHLRSRRVKDTRVVSAGPRAKVASSEPLHALAAGGGAAAAAAAMAVSSLYNHCLVCTTAARASAYGSRAKQKNVRAASAPAEAAVAALSMYNGGFGGVGEFSAARCLQPDIQRRRGQAGWKV